MYNAAGGENYEVLQEDGTFFSVYWSGELYENLFTVIQLGYPGGAFLGPTIPAPSLNSTTFPLIANLVNTNTGLYTTYTPGFGFSVNQNYLAGLVQAIDPNSYVLDTLFTNAISQVIEVTYLGTLTSAASGTIVPDAAEVSVPKYVTSITWLMAFVKSVSST